MLKTVPDSISDMIKISNLHGDSLVFNPELFENPSTVEKGYTFGFIKLIQYIYILFCNYIKRQQLNELNTLTLSDFYNNDSRDPDWYNKTILPKLIDFFDTLSTNDQLLHMNEQLQQQQQQYNLEDGFITIIVEKPQ